jgi:UDPglucose 6-dehydrogenase
LILGKAFKPGTNISVGSPAVLLSHLLTEREIYHLVYDPYIPSLGQNKEGQVSIRLNKDEKWEYEDGKIYFTKEPYIYFLATQHDDFKDWDFPKGSIIIDPFRYMPEQKEGVKYISVGVGEWSTLFT